MQITPDLPVQSNQTKSATCLFKDILMLLGITALFIAFWPDVTGAGAEEEDKQVRILFQLQTDTTAARRDLTDKVKATHRSFEGVGRLAILLSHDAVEMARLGSPDMPSELQRLMEKGVELLACREDLEARGIDDADLHPLAYSVESAEEEIRKRKADGWAVVAEGESYVSGLHDEQS